MPWERIVVPEDDKEWRAVFRFLREEAETSLFPFWDTAHLFKDGDLMARLPVTQEIELEEDAEYRKESKDEDWGCFLGSLHEPFYEERDDEQQDKRDAEEIRDQSLEIRELLKNGVHILTLS